MIMKRTLTTISLLLVATAIFSQEKNIKIVTYDSYGRSLETLLGRDKYEIDSLVITNSTVSTTDFGVLRDCCEKGRLTGIDLSHANIANRTIPVGAFMPTLMNGMPRKEAGESGESGYRTNLRYITLPKKTRKIGEMAFAYTNLVSVGIPHKVDSICIGAFDGCENLRDVYLYGGREQAEASGFAFRGLPSDAVLHVASGTGDNYRSSAGWSAFGTVVEDEDAYRVMDITVGGARTLRDVLGDNDMCVDSLRLNGTPTRDDFELLRENGRYGRLHSLDLTDCDVTNTGVGKLFNTVLDYLRMPKTMPTILSGFLSRAEVDNLTLPESYEEIESTAFEGFRKPFADSIFVVKEGCRKLGYMAFCDCHRSVNKIVLPSTLEELEPASLALTWTQYWLWPEVDLYINRVEPPYCSEKYGEWEVNEYGPFACFYNDNECCTKNWRLFVPVGAKKNYENAEHWNHFRTIIETPLLTGPSTGIGVDVSTEQSSDIKEVYTSDGRFVSRGASILNMPKGLYIVKENGTVRKVITGR